MKKLESLFDMEPIGKITNEVQVTSATEHSEKTEIVSVKDIDLTLLEFSPDGKHERDLDAISEKASTTFDTLMEAGLQSEGKNAGVIFDAAAKMLNIALSAKTSKMTAKLRAMELTMKAQKEPAKKDSDSDIVDGDSILDTRSNILDAIYERNKQISD